MKQQTRYNKQWHHFWLLVLLAAISSGYSFAQSTTDIEWLSFPADWMGRVAVFSTAERQYATEQPVVLRFIKSPSGKLAVTLTHTGYTEADPDGKSALVAATFQTAS